MTDHEGQILTSRDMVRVHLPIVLHMINTVSLVVVAVSAMHIGAHVHEFTHDGMIWNDPPAENAEHGHNH